MLVILTPTQKRTTKNLYPKPMNFPYKGVLFDMDGTLVHNALYHRQAWQEVALELLKLVVTNEDYALKVDGGRNPEIMARLTGQVPAPEAALEFHNAKEGRYRDLARGLLSELAGATAYLNWLEEHNIPCTLVTSSDPVNVEFVFEQIGLGQRFVHRVMGTDVQNGKPHPEPYLRGAALLGLEPEECLVHEDAVNGIKSGLDAGCTVCAIASHSSVESLLAAGAQFAVPDFMVWLEQIQQGDLQKS